VRTFAKAGRSNERSGVVEVEAEENVLGMRKMSREFFCVFGRRMRCSVRKMRPEYVRYGAVKCWTSHFVINIGGYSDLKTDKTNRFEDTRSPFPDKHMVFWAQGVGVVKHKHDMITDDLNPDRRLFPS
jgi:hypothetical protein